MANCSNGLNTWVPLLGTARQPAAALYYDSWPMGDVRGCSAKTFANIWPPEDGQKRPHVCRIWSAAAPSSPSGHSQAICGKGGRPRPKRTQYINLAIHRHTCSSLLPSRTCSPSNWPITII
ncbi:unnamed protein product [Bursaphelenchus xylophilus]|uniref:(pine wood nematode) hypothetical protein n=1 Tax=Bursaphelenchus xylophilus TaxID=6326 RepID=A0A1I7RH88_BURXY|nr:unnamed protein product [Bursaphelenchus xylophilus]CAG9115930.1 unnamed protein product [Bursaphelenchus xylophilus]